MKDPLGHSEQTLFSLNAVEPRGHSDKQVEFHKNKGVLQLVHVEDSISQLSHEVSQASHKPYFFMLLLTVIPK